MVGSIIDLFEHLRLEVEHLLSIIDLFEHLRLEIEHLRLADRLSICLSTCGWKLNTCGSIIDLFEHLRLEIEHLRVDYQSV